MDCYDSNARNEKRKDIFSDIREASFNKTATVYGIRSLPLIMEKEKPNFGQHSFDGGYRAVDLLKPSTKPRNIVPASLGTNQIHAMPPLIPNYITNSGHVLNPVPINNSLLKGATGAHSFQAHIPVGIGSSATSRISTSQRSLPSLKPTNISNQVQQLPTHIPGLPTILPPSSRTGSPSIASHGQSSDHRIDNRSMISAEGLRGNTQASSHSTTIQVIASNASHLPTSFLSKGMNSTSGMLKINTNNVNSQSSTAITGTAFKLGIGKHAGSSSIILPPATTVIPRSSDQQEIRNVVPTYGRFPTAAHVSLASHSLHPVTTTSSSAQESRPSHQVGYHPINAFVYHDMGHPIGLHNFPHQLIRPPSSSVPMFAIDRNLPTAIPLVTLPISKSNYQTTYTTPLPNNVEATIRPSILRKRPAESNTSVLYSSSERSASPLKKESLQITTSFPASKLKSPPLLTSNQVERSTSNEQPINHSIVSLTSDVNSNSSSPTLPTPSSTKTAVLTITTTVSKPPALTNTIVNSLEASPKKKPRKQLIITTEDKYSAKPPLATFTDEDEEFLKSNETIKDEITPPKVSKEISLSPLITSNRNLFSPVVSSVATTPTETFVAVKPEEDTPINGLISTMTKVLSNEPQKCSVFVRRPKYGITHEYKINTKAAHNHFFRASDIKVKEEKTSAQQDKLVTRASMEAASGWKLHYLVDQLDDLVSIEEEMEEQFMVWKGQIPAPASSPTSYRSSSRLSEEDAQLRTVHELLQGNLQRCHYSARQLNDTKQTMFKALSYKEKVNEVLMTFSKTKPKLKKKPS